MLRDSISDNLTIACHSIHLDLLGMLNKLRHHDGMILAHISSQLQEAFQLIIVRANIHGSTREHIRRTHQDGEAHTLHKLVDIIHRCQCTPLGLVDTQLVQHLRELSTVLSTIDILCLRAQDVDTLLVQMHSQVVWNLTTS